MPLADSKHLDSLHAGHARLDASDISSQRQIARSYLAALDKALQDIWALGRNVIIGWTAETNGIEVLTAPNVRLPDVAERIPDLLRGPRLFNMAQMQQAKVMLGRQPKRLDLPFNPGQDLPLEVVEAAVRRYSIQLTDYRAVVAFEIVDLATRPAINQVAQINALGYSINVAHERLLAAGFDLELARCSIGSRFYLWNRRIGRQADTYLYALTMLVLADIAIAQSKEASPGIVPRIATAFHISNHFESYQADRLNPGLSSFVVGDVVNTLDTLLDIALPNQVLIGHFECPITDGPVQAGRHYRMADTPRFMNHAQSSVDKLEGLRLEGEPVSRLVTYLTGEEVLDGVYNITVYERERPDGTVSTFFNAKATIHRGRRNPFSSACRTTTCETSRHAARSMTRHVSARACC